MFFCSGVVGIVVVILVGIVVLFVIDDFFVWDRIVILVELFFCSGVVDIMVVVLVGVIVLFVVDKFFVGERIVVLVELFCLEFVVCDVVEFIFVVERIGDFVMGLRVFIFFESFELFLSGGDIVGSGF